MGIGMMIRGGFSRFAGFRCRKMTSIRHLNSYFCGASAGYCSSGIPSEHSSAAPPTPPLNKMNAISSPSQFIGRPQPIFPRMETTEELVEVFSVFVHSFNHDVSTVKQDVVASKKKWKVFAEKVASFDNLDVDADAYWSYIPKFKQMLVAPLIQVFSISIHGPFETETATEIYGCVEAIEEQGNTFTLYDRDPHHCESIILGLSNNNSNLSLIGPEVCALTCRTVTTLHLHLNDQRQGTNIISSRLVLHSNNDKSFDSSCDKLIKAVVHGENGFSAHVYYATFRYGVFVEVRVGVVEKYDKTCDFVDIYGSIVARYGRTKSNKDDLENMKTTVFYKPPDQTIRAAVPTVTPIPLSRRIVAVPAYGTLKFDMDIWESGVQFATGSVEFDTFGFSGFERFLIGDRGVVCVKVSWNKRVYETKEHYLDLPGHFVSSKLMLFLFCFICLIFLALILVVSFGFAELHVVLRF